MVRKSTIIMGDDKVYVIYLAVMWLVLTILMEKMMFHG